MREDYRYLFPFEKIERGSRIIIYGAGEMGQAYLEQVFMTGFCEVVAMADQNYRKYSSTPVPVIAPDTIKDYRFDHVVVAIRVAIAWNEMHGILVRQGIPEEKIVCVYERKPSMKSLVAEEPGPDPGMEDGCISIACQIVGGLGDHVIQKRFLTELMRTAVQARITLYAIRHCAFLEYLFSDCPQVCSIVEDLGVRYEREKSRYHICLSVEACHYIRVDGFDAEAVEGINPEFARRMQALKAETEQDPVDLSLPVHVSIMRRLYRGEDVYSGFGHNGAFAMEDRLVTVPVTEKGERFFRMQGLTRYVTVNYGSGECRDERKVAKMWPLEYFSRTVSLIHDRYPELEVVQLGEASAPRISGADRYILGEGFEEVASVLKHAVLHLDIEGGLVHIATQLGTKCIVLFGPTMEEYYGYKENINIRSGNCGGCFGLYSDINRCAKGMERPRCMYSITPEMVLGQMEAYMETLKKDEGETGR